MKYGVAAAVLVLSLGLSSESRAFCGFYVARADTDLFNEASQVVLVRDGDRTVITMANDFSGDVKDFAMVIPVPTFLEREQINVGDRAVIEHLDAYTAPRLVEYFDGDPCVRYEAMEGLRSAMPEAAATDAARRQAAKALGVSIEASYTVGEYDIVILSAKESDGLLTWLQRNRYRLPKGAKPVVESYIKQGTRFFVARVNLEQQQQLGFSYLRPLQIAFESPKFMLPIRLGTVNAKGSQELFVYALTRTGRVETTNYRTVKLPSNVEVPTYIKTNFSDFYRSLFAEQTKKENNKAVFLEYAWDMSWCDPCAADPLSQEELRSLGVFWLDDSAGRRAVAPNVFVTRLHVRYDGEDFPEDLKFQETGDRSNYQGRYILRHAFEGVATCGAAETYRRTVAQRRGREAETLAHLTGWDINAIRERMAHDAPMPEPTPWWRRIWSSREGG